MVTRCLFVFIFRHRDADGKVISRTLTHATAVQKFLAGRTDYAPADILASWFSSPDGRLDETENSTLMYSVTVPYKNIKPVWACLTSFAVQTVEDQLVREATNAVKPSSGLHAVVSRKSSVKKVQSLNLKIMRAVGQTSGKTDNTT